MAGLVVDMVVTGIWRCRSVGQDDVIPDLLTISRAPWSGIESLTSGSISPRSFAYR